MPGCRPLTHPVYDPEHQITPAFFWHPERLVSAGLTANIGME
jgi:hypothetical protein